MFSVYRYDALIINGGSIIKEKIMASRRRQTFAAFFFFFFDVFHVFTCGLRREVSGAQAVKKIGRVVGDQTERGPKSAAQIFFGKTTHCSAFGVYRYVCIICAWLLKTRGQIYIEGGEGGDGEEGGGRGVGAQYLIVVCPLSLPLG